ncbi:hypothetical protein [Kitasatospora purpeofusca]|uniref:hypothetical protein n=1 Tax=Kitasatospora purpeofusca TaxID=67352 RepID=UPI0036D235D1
MTTTSPAGPTRTGARVARVVLAAAAALVPVLAAAPDAVCAPASVTGPEQHLAGRRSGRPPDGRAARRRPR